MVECWAREPTARPTVDQIIERLGREIPGADERPETSDTFSPPYFQQDAGRRYPSVDEFETFLWGTSTAALSEREG